MAHYANVEAGKVTDIIVAEQSFVDTLDGTWVKTDPNTKGNKHYEDTNLNEDSGTPLRKNYALIGGLYDSVKDAFYTKQPWASWVLDETTCIWEPPVAYPDDGKPYDWNEDTTSWREITQ